MKDPLYKKETPYEILGITTDADNQTIKQAFKKAFASRSRNVRELQQAHHILSDSVDRSFIDVFLYNESFLNQLRPRIHDSSRLLSRRMELAQAWSNIQKGFFPHFASTHNLALLWYYWALYCEEEQWANLDGVNFKKIENLSDPPPLTDLWSNTISNWVFLINSADFWGEWLASKGSAEISLNNNDINTLKEKLVNHFINIFRDFSTRYRQNDIKSTSTQRFKECEFKFSTEMATAKQLFDSGLQLPRGRKNITICCGRMMLEQVGILGDMRKLLKELKERDHRDIRVRELLESILESLSPYFNIAVLIKKDKYDAAIQAIEALSPDERKKVEVLRLLAKVYLEKGKQHFSLNQFEEALNCWKRALNTGKLSEEIKEDVVSNCKAKAASLQSRDPDTAIKILEKALKLVKNKELMLTLAEILNQRGVQIVTEIRGRIESSKRGATRTIKAEVKQGISCLERAVELGSEQAGKNLEIARRLLEGLESGIIGLSPGVAKLVQEANETVKESENFDDGIKILNRALVKAEGREKPAVKKILARFFNAHAVKKIEKAMTKINPIIEQHQEKISNNVADFLFGKSERGFMSVLLIILVIVAGIGYVIFGKIPKDFFERLGLSFFLFWLFVIILNIIGKIIDWFQKQISFPLIIGDHRPPCKLCSRKASYKYDLTAYMKIPFEKALCGKDDKDTEKLRSIIESAAKEIPFCDKHAEKLRSIIESVPKMDSSTKSLLHSAESDLKKAAKLDPDIKQVKQNLEHVENLLSRFNVK